MVVDRLDLDFVDGEAEGAECGVETGGFEECWAGARAFVNEADVVGGEDEGEGPEREFGHNELSINVTRTEEYK